jgi:hypothetical protein
MIPTGGAGDPALVFRRYSPRSLKPFDHGFTDTDLLPDTDEASWITGQNIAAGGGVF